GRRARPPPPGSVPSAPDRGAGPAVPERPGLRSGTKPMSPAPSSSQSRIQALRSLVNGESQSGTGHVDLAEPEEHRALRAAVAGIAAKFGPRYYAERATARRPCTELWQALGDAGFIGVNVPEAYGGGGGGLTELALVCEEIAAAGTPLLLLLVSAAISAEMISDFGTDEQRATWLPGLASGAVKVVFAITEPDAGSNTLRISTTASRVKGAGEVGGDDWVLHGTKYYISGVDEAQALLVVARTGQDERGGQLSLFIVPADAPGLQKHLLPVDLLLPERQFTLHFDGVRVGPGALVGEEGKGFRQVFHGLNPERITGAALGVGIARYALGAAAAHRAGQPGDDPQLRRPAQPGPAPLVLRGAAVDLARNLIGRINVGDSLTRTAASRPDRLAVVDGERRLSYRDFNGYVNRL